MKKVPALPTKISSSPEQVQALENFNALKAAANSSFQMAYNFHMNKMNEIQALEKAHWDSVCTQFGYADLGALDAAGFQLYQKNENGRWVIEKTLKVSPPMDGPQTKQ